MTSATHSTFLSGPLTVVYPTDVACVVADKVWVLVLHLTCDGFRTDGMTHGDPAFLFLFAHTPMPASHLVHTPTLSSATMTATGSQSTLAGSRPGTPPRDAGTPSAVGTPNGGVNKDGTVLLDCVGCGRPVRATCPIAPSSPLSNVVVLLSFNDGFRSFLHVDGF